jgi:hypothetical protein
LLRLARVIPDLTIDKQASVRITEYLRKRYKS